MLEEDLKECLRWKKMTNLHGVAIIRNPFIMNVIIGLMLSNGGVMVWEG